MVATIAIRAITVTVEDVPAAFTPLHVSSVVSLTILGVVAATGACLALNAVVERPVATFTRLVPFALALSFIPDIAIWVGSSYQGTARASTVVPLLIMHVAVAALTLVSLLRVGTRAQREKRVRPVTDVTSASAASMRTSARGGRD